MSTEILVAIIAFVGTLAGSYFSNNKNVAIMDEKIKDIKEDIKVLSERVNKHNNLIERMGIVEDRINHIEKDIDKLKKQVIRAPQTLEAWGQYYYEVII